MSLDATIRAEMPWAGSGRKYYESKHKMNKSILRYRGWTLVDCGDGWRWAVKDGTNTRVRVCRDHGVQQRDVMRRYREVVDEREDA
jgi:hypothetical protein